MEDWEWVTHLYIHTHLCCDCRITSAHNQLRPIIVYNAIIHCCYYFWLTSLSNAKFRAAQRWVVEAGKEKEEGRIECSWERCVCASETGFYFREWVLAIREWCHRWRKDKDLEVAETIKFNSGTIQGKKIKKKRGGEEGSGPSRDVADELQGF